ncbi:MAG: hypothetical protein OCC49_01235 [Fibrobacterales bacterium]
MISTKNREIFHIDGTLRDLFVKNTGKVEWQCLMRFLMDSDHEVSLLKNHEKIAITSFRFKDIFETDELFELEIFLDAVKVNCQFFISTEIELDIDPADIKTDSDAQNVFTFMEAIGTALLRNVLLTEENSENQVIVEYDHESNQMVYRSIRN